MSGRKILDGLNDALAWMRGEGRRTVHVVHRDEIVSEEKTFDEYRRVGMTDDDVRSLAEKAFRENREIIF